MGMVAEANQAFGSISSLVTEGKLCDELIGRSPLFVHLSLYRALKLTFPRDVGGLAHDDAIPTEIATESMSQIVGVLTPAMFRPGLQLLPTQ